ncbi:MAG: Gfo/Idh/MocA family oxidoreductase [Bacteroidales bacterium]|nr:Gfo/Idh/MocA family oxidoreductase [Bacteroidales bacterium]
MKANKPSSRRRFLENTALGAIGVIGASHVIQACAPGETSLEVVEPSFLKTAVDGQPLRAGVVGCGGRGSGAAMDFLNAGPNLSIVALADVFQDRIDDLRKKLKDQKEVELEDANCFVGFDAFKRLLEVDLDYVILATPPFFRPEHFQACVEARKHVFMEKPVAVDPVGARAVMAASKQAEAAGLCVVTGTQRRHQWSYNNVKARIDAGMIGDITSTNVYWNQNKLWHKEQQAGWTEMEFMLRDWVNWTWLSGDHIVEQHVHNIDVSNWFVGKHPLEAVSMGSRLRRPTGDCYDNFAVDFVYDKSIHMNSMCRQINDCANSVSEYIRGTKGYSVTDNHKIFDLYDLDGNVLYKWETPVDAAGESVENSPYVQEHIDLVTAIREGKQIVEAEETAISVLTAIMGRESAYTGKKVTWEDMMGSDVVLGPKGELSLGPVDMEKIIPIAGSAPE